MGEEARKVRPLLLQKRVRSREALADKGAYYGRCAKRLCIVVSAEERGNIGISADVIAQDVINDRSPIARLVAWPFAPV